MINTLFNLIFIVPGYFSFLIIKTFKIGFGRKADAFDKTIYSLLFDIPIFNLTFVIINNTFVTKYIKTIDPSYIEIYTISKLQSYFTTDIQRIFILSGSVLISSVIAACGWIIVVSLIGRLNNHFRKHKIFLYTDLWNKCFVKRIESIPVRVFQGNNDTPIMEGFLDEISRTLNEDVELKVFKMELFRECVREGLINEIEYVYYNSDKNLKVIVYKQDMIKKFLNSNEGDDNNE